MPRFVSLLIAALLLSLPGLCQETYLHQGTGLKLPPRVGSLSRGEIQDLGEGKEAIPYSSEEMTATITIYPRERAFKEEMKELEAALGTEWEHHRLLEKKKVKTGKRTGLKRRYLLQDKRKTLFSEIRLYALGPHALKLRITGSYKAQKAIERAGTRLMASILR